jgi:recombination protein RecA
MAFTQEGPQSPEAKAKVLDSAMAALGKQFDDKNLITRMGSRELVPIDVIPLNVFPIDMKVIGVGGVPRGRITEIFGPEGSGKTTFCLQAVASAQKLGGVAAYVDAEHALDPIYARTLGVDMDNLLISQPDYGEQALEVVDAMINTGAIDIIVIDSVAALVPKAELDGEMSDQNVGLHARLMSKAMRKLAGSIRRTNTAVIFVNQIREKIGVMFGSPETTTGGRALKFYASLRLDIRRIGQIKDGEVIIGNRTKIKAVKNKLASPYKETEIDLLYGQGIDGVGAIIDEAKGRKIIEASGAWLSYKNERIGQGRNNAIAFLKENPELLERIKDEVLA